MKTDFHGNLGAGFGVGIWKPARTGFRVKPGMTVSDFREKKLA
jgi:hypothetical protein